MVAVMDLIRKLRSPENKRVLQAIEELRVRGWLHDGSLKNIPLCHAQMQYADLLGADLRKVDLHQAHLEHADLSQANLTGAKLSRANMQRSNLSQAILVDADLFKANLQDSRNLTDKQLAQAGRLWGAIMPDGTSYDGRYNLAGDLAFAKWGRIDINDPESMASFLRVPLETYLRGQEQGARKVASEPA